jgi:hypothetical protein
MTPPALTRQEKEVLGARLANFDVMLDQVTNAVRQASALLRISPTQTSISPTALRSTPAAISSRYGLSAGVTRLFSGSGRRSSWMPTNSAEKTGFCQCSNHLMLNWGGSRLDADSQEPAAPLSKHHSSSVIFLDSRTRTAHCFEGQRASLEMNMTLQPWPMRHLLMTVVSSIVCSLFSASPGQAQFTRYPAQPKAIVSSETVLAGPPARRPIKQPLEVPPDGFWAVCFSTAGQCLVRGQAHIGSGAKCSCGVDPGYTR